MIQTPFDLSSVGKIASEIQCPVSQIAAVAKQLGIEPAGRINGIPHYGADAVERIAAHIRAGVTNTSAHRPRVRISRKPPTVETL